MPASAAVARPHRSSGLAVSDDAIERETTEVFRSGEVLSRKERGAQTKDETALVAEEKRRQKRHEDELQRLLKQALLSGSVFFRGNDRSPDDSSTTVARATEQMLAVALPEVFNRFEEAAARVAKGDLDALMTSENLLGLTPVFSQLQLVRDEAGIAVINSDSGPLAEMLAKIADRTSYGETSTGRYLADEFAKEPFGWHFDVVRLFAVALLRAGKIQATSKAQANRRRRHRSTPATRSPTTTSFAAPRFSPKQGSNSSMYWTQPATSRTPSAGSSASSTKELWPARSVLRSSNTSSV